VKQFKDIREGWDKDEEKAFANTLFYLARKGTRGSIKAGRLLVKAAKKTGDYLAKKVIAIMVPAASIRDLQALEDMGIDIPVYRMTPRQETEWKKVHEAFKIPDAGLSSSDLAKIKTALKDGKTVIGKTNRKDLSNKGKPLKILKVFKRTIGVGTHNAVYVDWGDGQKNFGPNWINSYTIKD